MSDSKHNTSASPLNEQEMHAFGRAANAVKIQGILSIIFGGLGLLGGVLMGLFYYVAAAGGASTGLGIPELSILLVLGFIFFFLPHVFFIVAGVYLLRKPTPVLVRVLTIINLILGFFWNLPILVTAIISLVMSADYDRFHARNSTTV